MIHFSFITSVRSSKCIKKTKLTSQHNMHTFFSYLCAFLDARIFLVRFTKINYDFFREGFTNLTLNSFLPYYFSFFCEGFYVLSLRVAAYKMVYLKLTQFYFAVYSKLLSRPTSKTLLTFSGSL